MARTRGASHSFHQDDGVLVDKEGNPVSAEALLSPAAVPAEDASAEHAPVVEQVYRCDPSTCGRDMNGWELIRLLDLILGAGAMKVELGAEDYSRLHPDVRRHFMRAR